MNLRLLTPLAAALAITLAGCVVNPVTGENELSLTSEATELRIGQEQYAPSQQSQGGLYYLDPELNFYISSIGKKLAAASDRPTLPYEFVVLNNSVPNAWALPGGKIAINRGLLLELDNEAELAAVLAHEIVHAAARHSAKQIDKNLLMGAGLQVLSIGLGDQAGSDLILQGAGLGAVMIQSKYGREAELESDLYGMRYMHRAGYDPQGAVSLQQTFLRLAEGRQSNWLEGLFASHPPSAERLAANRATATQLGGGTLNREAYQRKIARLRRDAPAYKAYDEGLKALGNKDANGALKASQKAVSLQGQESLFHELKGLSLHELKNNKAALVAFDRAVALNKHYFSHYLYRGLLHRERKASTAARQDLEASYQLLPTAMAAFHLGELALEAGDKQGAIRYFEPVAKGRGELANAARAHLARLELATAPDKYLEGRIALDNDGRLGIAVINRSPLTVGGLVVALQRASAYQYVEVKRFTVPGKLASGTQSGWLDSGVTLTAEQARQYRVVVLEAQIAD
jgi:predicted Zn-dependent protease